MVVDGKGPVTLDAFLGPFLEAHKPLGIYIQSTDLRQI